MAFKFPKGHARGVRGFSKLPELLSKDPAVQQELQSLLECIAFKTDLRGVNLEETPSGVTAKSLEDLLAYVPPPNEQTEDVGGDGQTDVYEVGYHRLKAFSAYSDAKTIDDRTAGADPSLSLADASFYVLHNTLFEGVAQDSVTAVAPTLVAPVDGVYLFAVGGFAYWWDSYWVPYIDPDTFSGAGLNDITLAGTYTGGDPSYLWIEIDGVGANDTFRWGRNPFYPPAWEGVGVACAVGATALASGMTAAFGAVTGHTLGDRWWAIVSNGRPQHVQAIVAVLEDGVLNWGESIINQPLSIFGSADAIENSLCYCVHLAAGTAIDVKIEQDNDEDIEADAYLNIGIILIDDLTNKGRL